ncbi:MAG: CDP-diacylglycerol O-phosphatidyltransferase [Bacteroidetes bacterium]|nr:CDP-diacylglycerol O-phosphatidyltransferase [Bacteroidota bacterium]
MSVKKHIPDFITILNLLSGCLAVTFVFSEKLIIASWLIGLAALFDFLDGMFARLLHVNNPFGKQLDSLADVISFGLVPGLIIMKLIETSLRDMEISGAISILLPYAAFLIPAFSALRLAKFNIDERQSFGFIGLPTPASAILIASFPLILHQNKTIFGFDLTGLSALFSNTYFLLAFTIILSYLLVAELPLFAIKFKTLNWKENRIRFIFLVISLLLLVIFFFNAIPLIIALYILLSLFLKDKPA